MRNNQNGNEMEIFITLKNTTLDSGVKKVTAANGDYLVYSPHLITVSNVFMRKGIYSLMFMSRAYNKYKRRKTPFNQFFKRQLFILRN